MNLNYIVKKSLHRLGRILTGKKGIWCSYGRKNVFKAGVFLHENCSVGSYNHFGTRVMIMNGTVGNYCSLAPDVKVGQMDHDLDCVSTSTRIFGPAHGITEDTGFDRPAVIENDVWLGANVVVRQGVRIGTGAVVGANAVVTRDIPPYAIAVGAPARVLRYRFSEEAIAILLESRWWELPPEEAVPRCKELQKQVDGL